MQLIKHKWKLIICLLFVFFAAGLLSACTYEFDPADEGYTQTVIYDANGGKYSNSDTTGIRTFKYKPDVSIIEPGGSQNAQVKAPTMDAKHVFAWFPATLDDEGNPLKNSDGEFVDENGVSIFEGEPWDFKEDRLPSDSGYKLYLVVKWKDNYVLTIDVGEDARDAGIDDKVYNTYTQPGPVSQPGIDPEWDGYTLYYYYYFNEQGERVRLNSAEDWSGLVLSENNPKITVYVEWVKGDWVVVSTASQLRAVNASKNYILANDIDMAGSPFSLAAFRGIFDGHGYTISNFVTTASGITSSATSFGAFSFYGEGCMKNITFANCSFSVSLAKRIPSEEGFYSVGFFCGDGTQLDISSFENIGFVDCSLSVEKKAYAMEESVVTGSGDYFGIFGCLAEGVSFTPAAGSNAVQVTVR